ncbi:unnamed protein product [Acanthoscelides obtectus]|uniref:Uncharacterized protein n=1 Tax=Acanthoscelides obtectus TaxID=200917 RepID=A0A9P0JUE5_ACAOB|nr:unnamed protein product [Acanthoscelides obtectus]CAK1647934.1 hypothetical protein AOBTE_LOCUS15462 [Acanthoscelides obtectus]
MTTSQDIYIYIYSEIAKVLRLLPLLTLQSPFSSVLPTSFIHFPFPHGFFYPFRLFLLLVRIYDTIFLDHLSSAILMTWAYHASCLLSTLSTMVSCTHVLSQLISFRIWSNLDTLHDRCRMSISTAFSCFSISDVSASTQLYM